MPDERLINYVTSFVMQKILQLNQENIKHLGK